MEVLGGNTYGSSVPLIVPVLKARVRVHECILGFAKSRLSAYSVYGRYASFYFYSPIISNYEAVIIVLPD